MSALKHSGPLLGYNNNVPYRGDVFHVQTEDSGSKRPHVFTHLFADGGRVVKTTKTSYAHYVGKDNLTDRVRALMREQHKGMVISLRDGELDKLLQEGGAEIEERTAPGAEPQEAAEPEGTPSTLAVLERAAAVDDREFYREMEKLVPDDPPSKQPTPPTDQSAGAYSFVGRPSGAPEKSTPPPAPGAAPATRSAPPRRSLPPRRMRSTKPPAEDDSGGPEAAPPSIDVAGGRRRRGRRTRDGPPESEDRPTSVYQRGLMSERTEPDMNVAATHASASSKFGARFMSDKRFDELIVAYLTR